MSGLGVTLRLSAACSVECKGILPCVEVISMCFYEFLVKKIHINMYLPPMDNT